MITEHNTIIKSINPATKGLLGEVPCFGASDVASSVEQAWLSFASWRLSSFPQRANKIMRLRDIIKEEQDEIATLITNEVGKPLTESYMAEIIATMDACVWFAENTKKVLKDQIVGMNNPLLASKESIIACEPLGVIGIIAPWNYPFAIPAISMIMALMAGNTVVFKPSEKSPLIGLKIGELFKKAGFPEAAATVITGDRTTGILLSQSKLARLIFTGSEAGGKQVMAQASERLTPVSLELGGKDPAIVLPDALDPQLIDWTVRGLTWGAFTNSGQACASIEIVYLVKNQNTNELIDKIVAHTQTLKIGPGIDPESDIGPLIDEIQLNKVSNQVEEARTAGAKILCGGRPRQDLGGYFYEPTVLINVNHGMSIVKDETFGPVLPIIIVNSEEEAIELTNKSDYGLSATIWTSNLSRAESVARKLEVGTVLVNDCLFSFACPQVPWGGLKKSGFGRAHSYFGLLDLVNIKHISLDAAGGSRRLWWYPYGTSRIQVAKGGIDFLHGSPLNKVTGLCRFIGNIFANPKSDHEMK